MGTNKNRDELKFIKDSHIFARSFLLVCMFVFTYVLYVASIYMYTVKVCLKRPLKIDKRKVLKTNGSLMKVKRIAECSLGPFCNTFDLHYSIIGIESQFSVFLRVAVIHWFYC